MDSDFNSILIKMYPQLKDIFPIFNLIKNAVMNNHPEVALQHLDSLSQFTQFDESRWNPDSSRWSKKIVYESRREWINVMSTWHLINSESLNKLSEFLMTATTGSTEPRILEIGAGMGLLAYFLRFKGVNMIATDSYTWISKDKNPYTEVLKMTYEEALSSYNPNILIVCWGISTIPFNLFKGKYYIYIGEPDGGCTTGYPEGTDGSSEGTDIHPWRLIQKIPMPCFYGLNDDHILIFERF